MPSSSSHVKYAGLREEAVKNKVAEDYFSSYEHTDIIGNIDFCIAKKVFDKNGNGNLFAPENKIASILWAEAKKGVVPDINESFVQLILTIGKARTFNSYIPPYFLGAFDAAKIAFIPYHKISAVFSENDFNWNVTPSNHGTKEFSLLYNLVQKTLDENSLTFNFVDNDKELREFIKKNFVGTLNEVSKIQIDKNNFTYVFQKWTAAVKPSISVDWDLVNKAGLLSADFFLADLLSENNKTLKEKLYILLDSNHYELDRKIDEMGFEESKKVGFSDKQKAHKAFWSIYERPPKKEYWEFFTTRRELLVPQDIRERKGSFFTPQIWVQKSQEYLAQVLGENWQDEYFIWDCCAGTGNLLNGLTNYRNVWASTIDKADVDVMKDRIENGWKMFENHVFQFDFLNDDFLPQNPETVETAKNGSRIAKGKIPDDLYEILTDEEKRKKLVIYINPPYAEAANKRTIAGKGSNREGLSVSKVRDKYKNILGSAVNELFALPILQSLGMFSRQNLKNHLLFLQELLTM